MLRTAFVWFYLKHQLSMKNCGPTDLSHAIVRYIFWLCYLVGFEAIMASSNGVDGFIYIYLYIYIYIYIWIYPPSLQYIYTGLQVNSFWIKIFNYLTLASLRKSIAYDVHQIVFLFLFVGRTAEIYDAMGFKLNFVSRTYQTLNQAWRNHHFQRWSVITFFI